VDAGVSTRCWAVLREIAAISAASIAARHGRGLHHGRKRIICPVEGDAATKDLFDGIDIS